MSFWLAVQIYNAFGPDTILADVTTPETIRKGFHGTTKEYVESLLIVEESNWKERISRIEDEEQWDQAMHDLRNFIHGIRTRLEIVLEFQVS
jgi:hypothetical protein